MTRDLLAIADRIVGTPSGWADGRWWRFAVIRGADLPGDLDGRWYDLDDLPFGPTLPLGIARDEVTFEHTHEWEQRDDGAVAVVYRRRT